MLPCRRFDDRGEGIMSEVKLGERFVCSECGTKFYDLGRPTAVCPRCQTVQDKTPVNPSRRKKSTKEEEPDIDEDVDVGEDVELVDLSDDDDEDDDLDDD